jgi:hypothetical protein
MEAGVAAPSLGTFGIAPKTGTVRVRSTASGVRSRSASIQVSIQDDANPEQQPQHGPGNGVEQRLRLITGSAAMARLTIFTSMRSRLVLLGVVGRALIDEDSSARVERHQLSAPWGSRSRASTLIIKVLASGATLILLRKS